MVSARFWDLIKVRVRKRDLVKFRIRKSTI